jgi:hypothetical protein
MPGYRAHLITGLVTYLVLVHLLKSAEPSASTLVLGLMFCLCGALFPDIDVKSKGQKLFYILLLCLLIYLMIEEKYCMFAVMSFLGIIPLLVRHRGVFHYIWFLTAMACAFSLMVKSFCGSVEQIMLNNVWFFFAGSVSHVLLDRAGTKCKQIFSR